MLGLVIVTLISLSEGTSRLSQVGGIATSLQCDSPTSENPDKLKCAGVSRDSAIIALADQQMSLKQTIMHCQEVADSVGGTPLYYANRGYGLGYCIASNGQRCQPYKTCMMTLPVSDQLGVGHLEIGGFILVTEATTIRSHTDDFRVTCALLRKDSMFRACPVAQTPPLHYLKKANSHCTHNHGNGDTVTYIDLPFTMEALHSGLIDSTSIREGVWYNAFKQGGSTAVEMLCRNMIRKNEIGRILEAVMSLKTDFNKTQKGIESRVKEAEEAIERSITPDMDACHGWGRDNSVIRWSACGKGRLLGVFTNMLVFIVLASIVFIVVLIKLFTFMGHKREARYEKPETPESLDRDLTY